MPVTMEHVVKDLGREHPNYSHAARLGAEALPHLVTLIQGSDLGLATKAASLAGKINAPESAAVLEIASRHPKSAVRVAAAASTQNLASIPKSLATDLLNDSHPGVRKWMLKALEGRQDAGIRTKVEDIMNNDPDEGLRERARKVINQLQ